MPVHDAELNISNGHNLGLLQVGHLIEISSDDVRLSFGSGQVVKPFSDFFVAYVSR